MNGLNCSGVKTDHPLFALFYNSIEYKLPSKASSKFVYSDKARVAARLRSLRSDDPSSKGHPRSIKQELETWKHLKLIHELLDS